ncbi:MAG: sortase [Chloroflexi bacterium]|nr:sortase [Chloroflexota bacterium]
MIKRKTQLLLIISLMMIFLSTSGASAQPVCGEKDFCDSLITVNDQSAPIPYSGDSSWMSFAPQLFGIEVLYSDGLDFAVDPQPTLIYTCSLDGLRFDTCEKEQFTKPGSWPMRVTVARSDALFYYESYADATLIISDQVVVDPDGIQLRYHTDGADSGSAPVDDLSYQFGDPAPIMGNLGLDADGNPDPLKKEGFLLTGWSTSNDGEGKIYNFGQIIAATTDLDLYPVWETGTVAGTEEVLETPEPVAAMDAKELPQPEVIVHEATVVPFKMLPFMPAENPRFDESIPLETVVPVATMEPVAKKPQLGDDWYLVSESTQVPPLEPAVTAESEPLLSAMPVAEEINNVTFAEVPFVEEKSAEIPEGSVSDEMVDAQLAEEEAKPEMAAMGIQAKQLPTEEPGQPGIPLPMTGFSIYRNFLPSKPMELSYVSLGMELQLPLLDVTTQLVWVPLTDNHWEVEGLEDRGGVLEGSAIPGEGVSMIAAHNHLTNQRIGPFLFIGNLKENDRIFVRKSNGELIEFVVRYNALYKPNEFAEVSEKAFEYDKTLVLITCENESYNGSYLDRRVIFAELQSN